MLFVLTARLNYIKPIKGGRNSAVLYTPNNPLSRNFNLQFAPKKGSPVQGELSVDRLTEGLILTNRNKKIEPTLPSLSCENATSPYTGEALC